MTCHSAQSQTVERVLISVNTSDPRLRGLLNEVFAYVAASRPEYDLRLFADRASELHRVLSRENEEQKAHSPEQIAQYRDRLLERLRPAIEQHQEKSQAQDFGIAI